MEQDIDPHPASSTKSPRYTAWQLIKLYWQSSQRFPAYIFFSIVLIMTVSLVGLDVLFNYYYYYFYDVLYAYDKHGAMRVLLVFAMLSAYYILYAGYRYGFSLIFGLRWRRWLTETFVKRLAQKADQRIHDDVDALINYSFDLSMGLIGVITTFLVLMYVLWQMSDVITLPLGSWGELTLPGYFVWIGIVYALVGTYFTFKTGRPFLSGTIKTMSHKAALDAMFGHPVAGVQQQKLFSRFSVGCYQLSVILPLMIVMPSYFDKVFLISWLLQSLQAFNRVQDTVSFVVNRYSSRTIRGEVQAV